MSGKHNEILKSESVHYFLMRGHTEYHDADEWIGIYDDPERAKVAYENEAKELERERRLSWIPEGEKVMLNSFDEETGKWRYDITIDIGGKPK